MTCLFLPGLVGGVEAESRTGNRILTRRVGAGFRQRGDINTASGGCDEICSHSGPSLQEMPSASDQQPALFITMMTGSLHSTVTIISNICRCFHPSNLRPRPSPAAQHLEHNFNNISRTQAAKRESQQTPHCSAPRRGTQRAHITRPKHFPG